MKVALSIGFGRLHLVQSAAHLAAAGCGVRLICGWVPKNPTGRMVRFCSKVVGRDLSYGMKKRAIRIPGVKIVSIAWVDFLDQALRIVCGWVGVSTRWVAAFSWSLFGRCSKGYIRDVQILHLRSGAGRGDAIAHARRQGIKVVCDHSIAHPNFMNQNLRTEYEKNGMPFDSGMDSPFWRQVIKDCVDADVVMVNSFFVKDTFVENGFAPEKIRVVYLGQREDFFGLRQKKFSRLERAGRMEPLKLLFTGGFGFRKGGEYILDALTILKHRGIAFEMDVVGDYSSARGLIARYEADLGISYASNIKPQTSSFKLTFHGQKPQDELKSFLANSDIYVFPSLAEGCAQSGMEAMAAGMCVIGTHESGFPITDGDNGYVVPSKDAKAVADRIEWLNGRREEIDRIGANAAELIRENYTWEKYAENVKNLYEEIVK